MPVPLARQCRHGQRCQPWGRRAEAGARRATRWVASSSSTIAMLCARRLPRLWHHEQPRRYQSMWQRTSFARLAGSAGSLGCCCSRSVCWRGARDRTSCRRPTCMCRPRRIPLPTSPRPCAPTPWTCSMPRTGSPCPGTMGSWPMAMAGHSRWRWAPVWSKSARTWRGTPWCSRVSRPSAPRSCRCASAP